MYTIFKSNRIVCISNLNRGDSALITIRKDILFSTLTNLINNIEHIFVKISFNNKQCIVDFIYIPLSFPIIIIYKYFIDSVQSVLSINNDCTLIFCDCFNF